MDQPIVERRVDPRVGQPAIADMRAMLRPGVPVVLQNVSAGGALIEAARPLKPGSRVHMQLVSGSHRFGLAARVVRCAVSSLDQGIQYRGALKFDHRCPELWEQGTHVEQIGYGVPVEAGVISDPRDTGVTRQDAAIGGTDRVRPIDPANEASAGNDPGHNDVHGLPVSRPGTRHADDRGHE
jgi:PilZ domain